MNGSTSDIEQVIVELKFVFVPLRIRMRASNSDYQEAELIVI